VILNKQKEAQIAMRLVNDEISVEKEMDLVYA
jgi:hypothetical protein